MRNFVSVHHRPRILKKTTLFAVVVFGSTPHTLLNKGIASTDIQRGEKLREREKRRRL
jgi:hypothetical protein